MPSLAPSVAADRKGVRQQGSRSPTRSVAGPNGAVRTPSITASHRRADSPSLLKGSMVDITRRMQGLNSRNASPVIPRRTSSPVARNPPPVVLSVTSRQAASPRPPVSRGRSPVLSARQGSLFKASSSASLLRSPFSDTSSVAGANNQQQRRRPSLQLDVPVAHGDPEEPTLNPNQHTTTVVRATTQDGAVVTRASSTTSASRGPPTTGSQRETDAVQEHRTKVTVPSQRVVRVRANSPPTTGATTRSVSAGRWRRDEGEAFATIHGHVRTVDVSTQKAVDPYDGKEYVYTTTTTTLDAIPHPTTNGPRPLAHSRPPSLALLTQRQGSLRTLNGHRESTNNLLHQQAKGRIDTSARSTPSTPRGPGLQAKYPITKTTPPPQHAEEVSQPPPLVQRAPTAPLIVYQHKDRQQPDVPNTMSSPTTKTSPPRSRSPVLAQGITAARAARWVTEFEDLLRAGNLPFAKWNVMDGRAKEQLLDRWRVPEMKRRVIRGL